MTMVRFELDPELEKIGPEIPVEISPAYFFRATNTTSSKTIELQPGRYLVTPRVPGVEGITQLVNVSAEDMLTVKLEAKSNKPAPDVPLARTPGFLGAARRMAFEAPLSYVRSSFFPISVRVFRGNVFDHVEAVQLLLSQSESLERTGAQVRVRVPPQEEPTIAQLLVFGMPPINLVLPIAKEVGCALFVHQRTPEPLIACSIEQPQARLLLAWRNSGHLSQAQTMLQSGSLSEQLLFEKTKDPIAAAVGAYTLLRMGEVEKLHDWTNNLMERFPKMPDGAVIRGEHLARLGRHEEAAEAFLAVKRRGMPIFLDGVYLLTGRLEFYSGATRLVGASRVEPLRDFQKQFALFTAFMNSRRTVASFSGKDPTHPDDEKVLDTRVEGASIRLTF